MLPTKADPALPDAHGAKQPLLAKLSDEQVFVIRKAGTSLFQIAEQCDDYFGMMLTRAELRDLAEEIRQLADTP